MSGLDKELEAAYAAQQTRQKNLEQSRQELEAVSAQGAELASKSKMIGITLVALAATAGSAILIIDPDSRPWGFLLFFVVAVGGAWSFYRNWRR